jgi:transcription initiation factor TFIID subunit TAF12
VKTLWEQRKTKYSTRKNQVKRKFKKLKETKLLFKTREQNHAASKSVYKYGKNHGIMEKTKTNEINYYLYDFKKSIKICWDLLTGNKRQQNETKVEILKQDCDWCEKKENF